MKKLLIFLGFLTLSSHVFSIDDKQTNPMPQKQQLSNWDKAKVGSAILGCAFFIWSTLLNRSTKIFHENSNEHFSIQHMPSVISIAPFKIANEIYKYFNTNELMLIDTAYNTSAVYSPILAILCGSYVGKKLIQSKKASSEKV